MSQSQGEPAAAGPAPFDLEREARAYVLGRPNPQTEAEVAFYVNDLVNKDGQTAEALMCFRRDVAADITGKRLLEFGCGVGGMAFALEREGAEVVGADIDGRALAFARRWGQARGSRVQFVAIGETLPFADASFDLIFSSSTFEHVRQPSLALRELARILRPDGVAYVCFPNRLYPDEGHTGLRFLPWLPRRLGDRYLQRKRPGWTLDEMSLYFYSYWQFAGVLRRSGADLRVVCPVVAGQNARARVKRLIHAAGIPFSAFTPGLLMRLEKSRG